MGEPTPLSAAHGEGLAALYTLLEPYALRPQATVPPPVSGTIGTEVATVGTRAGDDAVGSPAAPAERKRETKIEARNRRAAGDIHLAIVGRPNVGKSTLVNQLLGYVHQPASWQDRRACRTPHAMVAAAFTARARAVRQRAPPSRLQRGATDGRPHTGADAGPNTSDYGVQGPYCEAGGHSWHAAVGYVPRSSSERVRDTRGNCRVRDCNDR